VVIQLCGRAPVPDTARRSNCCAPSCRQTRDQTRVDAADEYTRSAHLTAIVAQHRMRHSHHLPPTTAPGPSAQGAVTGHIRQGIAGRRYGRHAPITVPQTRPTIMAALGPGLVGDVSFTSSSRRRRGYRGTVRIMSTASSGLRNHCKKHVHSEARGLLLDVCQDISAQDRMMASKLRRGLPNTEGGRARRGSRCVRREAPLRLIAARIASSDTALIPRPTCAPLTD
jgi:hypothetical protein